MTGKVIREFKQNILSRKNNIIYLLSINNRNLSGIFKAMKCTNNYKELTIPFVSIFCFISVAVVSYCAENRYWYILRCRLCYASSILLNYFWLVIICYGFLFDDNHYINFSTLNFTQRSVFKVNMSLPLKSISKHPDDIIRVLTCEILSWYYVFERQNVYVLVFRM